MVAIKFLGLIVTFYLFVVLEAFGQNFYPARYGKRDENGEIFLHLSVLMMGRLARIIYSSYQSKSLSENKRIGRSENQDGLNRKMGFFISSGRFGKRGCSENCFEGSKETISGVFQNRQDRSERIRIPIRKNQFMMGSRFGKRMDGDIGVTDSAVIANTPNLRCVFFGISDLYKCLESKHLSHENVAIESNFSGEFFGRTPVEF